MINIPLDTDERIVLTSYRHWVNLVPVFVSGVVLLAAAVVLAYIGGRYSNTLGKYVPTSLVMVVMTILILLAGLIILTGWWVYRRNQLVLTTHHLVKVEQNGLFARRISQLSLSRVQDVNGSRHGLVATLLDYGNVEVQTAGEQEEFIFIQMPNPANLANKLVQAHDDYGNQGSNDGTGTAAKPAEAPSPAPTPAPPPVQAALSPAPPPQSPLHSPAPSPQEQPQPLVENQPADLTPSDT